MALSDVLGQEHAVQTLTRALTRGKLHHALLLDGPSGVGKSFLARELARTILCLDPADASEACGSCSSCRAMERDVHPDLTWLTAPEGKSSIGVAQIRDVRGIVELPPHASAARTVVIDAADLMTPEAQNALLKTLEEPTSTTHLVLTTSRAQNLLPTVRSRCSRLRLAPLSDETVVELTRQARDDASESSVALAAALSQGSVTRAADLLDQDLDDLLDLVGGLASAVESGNVPELLRRCETIATDRGRLVLALELLALVYRETLAGAAGLREPIEAIAGATSELRRSGAGAGVESSAARLGEVLGAIEAISQRNANARLTVEAMLLRMLS